MRDQRQRSYDDESRGGRDRDEQHWERPRNERGEFERFGGGDMDRDRPGGGDWRTQGDGEYMDSSRGRGNGGRQEGQFNRDQRDQYGSSYGNQGGYGMRDEGWGGSPSRGPAGEGNGGRMGRMGQGEYGGYGEQSFNRGDRSGMSSWGGSSQRSYEGYNGPSYSNGPSYGQGGSASRSWRGESSMDQRESSYAGKGPKNYQRSDDRIREDVSDRLTDDHRIDASEISVEVRNGDVTLTGTVQDREQKRRAEDLAEQVSGVQNVTNNLKVSKSDRDRSSERSTASSGRPDGSFGSMESGNKSKSQPQTRQ